MISRAKSKTGVSSVAASVKVAAARGSGAESGGERDVPQTPVSFDGRRRSGNGGGEKEARGRARHAHPADEKGARGALTRQERHRRAGRAPRARGQSDEDESQQHLAGSIGGGSRMATSGFCECAVVEAAPRGAGGGAGLAPPRA